MERLTSTILEAPQAVVLLIAFALVFAEDALFLGFVIPGETAAVLAGVHAARSDDPVQWTILAVVAAAVIGDSVGYEVGKHAGPKLLAMRRLDRHRPRIDRARDLLARRGGSAVFLGRFTAFFRAVMPALAGASRMPYRRFLPYNAAGGILWGTGMVLIGFLAGNSYEQVAARVGTSAALVVTGIVVAAIVVWVVRRRIHERRETAAAAAAAEGS